MPTFNRAREGHSHQTGRKGDVDFDDDGGLDSSKIRALVKKYEPPVKATEPTSKPHSHSKAKSSMKVAEVVLIFPPCYVCGEKIVGVAIGGVFRTDEDSDTPVYICGGGCRKIFTEKRESTRLASYLAYVARQKALGNNVE